MRDCLEPKESALLFEYRQKNWIIKILKSDQCTFASRAYGLFWRPVLMVPHWSSFAQFFQTVRKKKTGMSWW